jgi:hypothetical protein
VCAAEHLPAYNGNNYGIGFWILNTEFGKGNITISATSFYCYGAASGCNLKGYKFGKNWY